MKNVYFLYFLGFFLISPLFSTAQTDQIIRCAADEYHEQQMHDPLYAQNFRAIQTLVQQQLQYRTPSCVTPIIIPVAVHFNGGITNANMACIESAAASQVAVLNADFGGYNGDIVNYCTHASNCPAEYAPNALAGGTCIQFCLATKDHPIGSGLVDGESAFTFGQYDFDSGAAPWAGYLNFFVSNIPPDTYSATLLGLAPLYGGQNPNGNGVFITSSAFGAATPCTSGVAINNSLNYNLGRTGTHEVGHFFGLFHVFDGCANGDGMADTPDQSVENTGVPTINYGGCVSTAGNSCATQDFFFNYMDYVDDAAMYMFTSAQADRMNATATLGVGSTNPYKTAATSCAVVPSNYTPTFPSGCSVNTPPQSAFVTTAVAPYDFCIAMNEMSFMDTSTDFPTSWSWTFSGAGVTPTTSTSQNPTVQLTSTGVLTVTLTASNVGGGADPTPATMNYTITILPAQDCGNCGENFVDSGGAGGNYSNNENMTWTLCAADPNDVVVVDFSSIDIGSAAFEDALYIKYGATAPTGSADADFVVTLSNVFVDQGGGSYGSVSNTIVSSSPCMSFRFISDGAETTAGWQAAISCITAPTCNDGIQNQDETFVDCGGAICNTCPTACQGFTFYDAGGANNLTGAESHTWQICADVGENTIVHFTTIDMNPFNEGVLQVYDAVDNSGAFDYYISGNAIYLPAGGNSLAAYGSNTITSTNECFFFNFFANSSVNGWVADVSCSAPLPINLTSFNAQVKENTVLLDWMSEDEVNVDQFIVQRREQNRTNFATISSIDACGTCSSKNTYHFVDKHIRKGVKYAYRLKILDFDGQYTYSDIVNIKTKDNTNDWRVYPNPGQGVFTIQLPENSQTKSILIINNVGKMVYESDYHGNDQYLNINLNELSSGVYQIVLIGDRVRSRALIILPN